jgi:hypothetical protein
MKSPTGIIGLDEITGGGKTILALQSLVNGALNNTLHLLGLPASTDSI